MTRSKLNHSSPQQRTDSNHASCLFLFRKDPKMDFYIYWRNCNRRKKQRREDSIRRTEWQYHELVLLKEVKSFLSDKAEWKRVQEYIPGRSAKSCHYQWKRWKRIERQPPEEETQLEPTNSIRFKPQDFSQIPFLPFQKICSFLDHKDVFVTLPQVCQHFRGMINQDRMPVASIGINLAADEPVKMLMLAQKVKACPVLKLLSYPRQNERFWQHCTDILLKQLKHSVEALKCSHIGEIDVINLVNESRSLRTLTIYAPCFTKWNWDKHEINHRIRTLNVDQTPLYPAEVESLLDLFPEVNNVTFNPHDYEDQTREAIRFWKAGTQLTNFAGQLGLQPSRLQWVETLVTGLHVEEDAEKLLHAIPHLKRLVKITLDLWVYRLHMIGPQDDSLTAEIRLSDIVGALKRIKSLKIVRVEAHPRLSKYSSSEKIAMNILSELSKSVELVTYNEMIIIPTEEYVGLRAIRYLLTETVTYQGVVVVPWKEYKGLKDIRFLFIEDIETAIEGICIILDG